MVTVKYEQPFTNNVEKDVSNLRESYLRDLEKLREFYGPLFVKAAYNSKSHLRRIV